MRTQGVVACVAIGVLGVLLAPAAAFQEQAKPVTPPPAVVEAARKAIAEQSAKKGSQPIDLSPVVPVFKPKVPVWTDGEFERLGGLLTGSWRSTEAVAAAGEGQASLVMNIAPVLVEGLPDALYCEVAREDAVRLPFRQTILAMQKVSGKVRISTYEFRRAGGLFPPANLMWAATEVFPSVKSEDLIATLAIDLDSTSGKCHGKTPHAYPTGSGGAVEMTSEITFDGSMIQVADRGFDAQGKQAWGPATNASTTFGKFDMGVKVNRLQDGLVSITLPSALAGQPAKDGEIVMVNYAIYLPDGRTHDTSYQRGEPLPWKKGGQMLEGWTMLMGDAQTGMVRRLVIPSKFAVSRAFPPNSDLFIDLEVLSVQPAPPPAPAPAPALAPTPVPAPAPDGDPTSPTAPQQPPK